MRQICRIRPLLRAEDDLIRIRFCGGRSRFAADNPAARSKGTARNGDGIIVDRRAVLADTTVDGRQTAARNCNLVAGDNGIIAACATVDLTFNPAA